MKWLSVFVVAITIMSFSTWNKDFDTAKKEATAAHKYILLNFSGSDWCGPCIRLRKEIFESDAFSQYATSNLVLVNADFPRLKKNQPDKKQQQQNDQLADKYNNKGAFPYTVLLTAEGKVLKSWDGLPKERPEDFINEIKAVADASK